jgi:DNA-binding SARP family transcriptional activator
MSLDEHTAPAPAAGNGIARPVPLPAWPQAPLQAAAAVPPAPPHLSVTLLDGFSMRADDDTELPAPAGRACTVLKLLLLRRGRALSRARLTAALWPQAEPESARNCLNVMLHRVRRALGHAATVLHTPDGYRFAARGDLWLDAEQFLWHAEHGRRDEAAGHATAARHHYQSAVALYRADLQDEDDGDPVLAGDAQALRDRHREVLERLAALLEAAGDWHACLQQARQQLAADPCNEHAHRRVMRCQAQLGQLERAERQFRHCVQLLRERFGLPPSEETTSLYRRIASRMAA